MLAACRAEHCELVIDGMRIRIVHQRSLRRVLFQASLARFDAAPAGQAMALLGANFIGRNLPGAVFGTDADGAGRLSMHRRLDALTADSFFDALERFVSHLEAHGAPPPQAPSVAR